MGTIKSFTDLKAWQEGHKLIIKIYEITKLFPPDEQFGLTSQIRRAAVSITSNIAERFSRESSKEKIKFYYISKGSLIELQNQLLIAKDVNYLTKEKFTQVADQSITVHKILNGLISKTKTL